MTPPSPSLSLFPSSLLQLRSLSCGPGTFAVAADSSVITWGAASNGELGYGPQGKKSSAIPGKLCGVSIRSLWIIIGGGTWADQQKLVKYEGRMALCCTRDLLCCAAVILLG